MKTLFRRSVALGAVLIVASGLAGMAQAADLMEPPDYSWSGLYVGAYAGAGALLNRIDLAGGGTSLAFDDGNDGFLYGALLGFNWQASERFVLGLQGDIALYDMDAASTVFGADIGPDFIASASLRAGFLVTPDTLLYAIGGYSHAEMDYDDINAPDDFDDGPYDGYHIGAGLETRLTERLTARVEYRYTDLGNRELVDQGGQTVDMGVQTHTGTLGLAYNLFPTPGEGAVAAPAAQMVEPAVSWTGLYAGVNGGGGALLLPGFDEFLPNTLEQGSDGFLGSLLAGFNWQAGERFVLGLEGAVGMSDMQWDFAIEGGNAGQEFNQKLDWFASASLRAGFLVSPETMIYVIGGYSHAEMDFETQGTGALVLHDKDSDGVDGYHAGAGIEAMLTDSLTARIEYRYTDYGTADFEVLSRFGTPQEFDTDARTHTGTIGLAWLFN